MRPSRKIALVAILMCEAMAGCSSPPSQSEPAVSTPESTTWETPRADADIECPTTPIEVTIDYEIEQLSDGSLVVVAHSNLPDTAELMASLYADEGAYFAQDTNSLVDGAAEFGPFSDDAAPLQGAYEMAITLPIARNQPARVREGIGQAGELLTGPLVSRHEITGDNVASLDVVVTIE